MNSTPTRPEPARSAHRAGPLALALVAALGCAAVAPAAFADDDDARYERAWHHDRGGKHGRHGVYDPYRHDARYDGGYDGDHDGRYAQARVLDVRPRTRQVRVDVPTRECWDETRWEEPRRRGVAGPMILGGVIGGALGSQVGRGDGRRAATVAGAIIGTALGHDVGERSRGRDRDDPRPYTVQRCDERWETRYDERIEGYDVTYEYGGRTLRTRLPYDPGPTLRVRVDVQPAGRW